MKFNTIKIWMISSERKKYVIQHSVSCKMIYLYIYSNNIFYIYIHMYIWDILQNLRCDEKGGLWKGKQFPQLHPTIET